MGSEMCIRDSGTPIPAHEIQKVWHREGRPKALGRPLDPYTAIWFKLESPPVRRGLNTLGITPLKLDPLDTDEIMIEEVEVGVMPRPVGEEE